MNRTRKTEAVGVTRIASIWRHVVKLFRQDYNRLLVASLNAFNEPRIYFPPDFTPAAAFGPLPPMNLQPL
jgi:hypothetical protein